MIFAGRGCCTCCMGKYQGRFITELASVYCTLMLWSNGLVKIGVEAAAATIKTSQHSCVPSAAVCSLQINIERSIAVLSAL